MSSVILKDVHDFLLNYKVNEHTHKEIMLFLFNSLENNIINQINLTSTNLDKYECNKENIVINSKFGIIKSKRNTITLKSNFTIDTNGACRILKFYIIFDEFEDGTYKLQLNMLIHKSTSKKPYIHKIFKMISGFKKKETITGKRYCTIKFNGQKSKYLSYRNLYNLSTTKDYYKLNIVKLLSDSIEFFIPLLYNYDPYKIIKNDLTSTSMSISNYFLIDYFLISSFTIPPKYFSNVTKYLIKKYKFSRLNIGQLVIASINHQNSNNEPLESFNYNKVQVHTFFENLINNNHIGLSNLIGDYIYFQTSIIFSYFLNTLMKNFIFNNLTFDNLLNYIMYCGHTMSETKNININIYDLIFDTLMMLRRMNLKVRMLKPKITSEKAFKEQHDKIMIEHRVFLFNNSRKLRKQNNKIFKINEKYNPILDNIDLYNLKTLTTRNAIIDLGNDQNHCIATYSDQIIRGDLLLLIGDDHGETCTTTIELNYLNGKFEHSQSKLRYNKQPSKEYFGNINELVRKANNIFINIPDIYENAMEYLKSI